MRRGAGIVRTFQTIKLFGDMTVLEHVIIGFSRHSRLGLRDALFGRARLRQQAEHNVAAARDLLAFVGLARYEATPANALAYGHRRLLEIARALAVQPKLLLLDEPAAGLVAEEITALADLILRLKAIGMTVLLDRAPHRSRGEDLRSRHRARLRRRHCRRHASRGAAR